MIESNKTIRVVLDEKCMDDLCRRMAMLTIEVRHEQTKHSTPEESVEMDWYIAPEPEVPEPEEIIVWNGNFIIC